MPEMNDRSQKGFRKLLVWKKAHDFVLQIYRITDKFPRHEMFGLTSQLRRAAVSVVANLVEGNSSGTHGQHRRYLDISQASLSEVEYYLILARDLGYLAVEEYSRAEGSRAEIGFLLYRLIQSIR